MFDSSQDMLNDLEGRLSDISRRLHNLELSGQRHTAGYNELSAQAEEIERDILRLQSQIDNPDYGSY